MNESDSPHLRATHDEAYTRDLYDEGYYARLVKSQDSLSYRWRCRWLREVLKPTQGDLIVDLGCGAGMVSKYLLSRGAEVHGVDLSESAIQTAKTVNAQFPKGSFQRAEASHCPHLEDGSFNKACSVDVTEHCGYEVMLDIFSEAHRLLKPGGFYYVYTPNPYHWLERLKQWGLLKKDPSHTGLRPANTIIDGLRLRGFEIVRVYDPVSMIPIVQWLEWLWKHQPLFCQLAIYRIAILARKPVGAQHKAAVT